MEKTIESSSCAICILLLFTIANLSFVGGDFFAANEIVVIVQTSIAAYLYSKKMLINSDTFTIDSLVVILLMFNILVNNCGIGAICHILTFYFLLICLPYIQLDDYVEKIILYFSIALLFYYSWTIEGKMGYVEVNANTAGLYIFSLFNMIVITVNLTKKTSVFWILLFVFSLMMIIKTECRSAMFAICLVAIGKILPFCCSISSSKLKILANFVLWGGLLYVFLNVFFSKSNLANLLLEITSSSRKVSTLSSRPILWTEALDHFANSPIVGCGSGLRLTNWAGDSLALHNSSLNFLIVYGGVIYVIIFTKLSICLGEIVERIKINPFVLTLLVSYISVLLVGYVESCLLDNLMMFSMMPLILTFSLINKKI